MQKQLIILLILSSISFFSHGQEKIPPCEQAKALCLMMNEVHYKPLKVNNVLSQRTFKNFVESLDPYKYYLTSDDIRKLAAYEKVLDDLIIKNSCEFVTFAAELYEKRLVEIEELTDRILDEGFAYDKEEFITLYYNHKEQPVQNNLEEYWRIGLKHSVVSSLYSDHRDSTGQLDMAVVMQHEPAAREKLRARRKCIMAQKRGDGDDLYDNMHELFLNAIAASFDPHSMYFTQEDNDYFQAEMATEALSFGIDFDENRNDELIVGYLWPGGAAWETGIIKKDDVVKKISFDRGTPLNLVCLDLYELILQLSSSKVNEMELTCKRKNGTLYTTTLRKSVQKVGYNRTKSFLLNGDKKIAYLSIPSFYTAEEENSPNGVSNDVAKEIIQLKKEGMEGLIIDLRNNTGGSLDETMNIAGSFVDEGLLFVQQYSDGDPELVKDENSGTLYDGPIVMLVNGNSSSAAEVLPAAMQCYNRAVIVGTTTHGKSSSQVIIPLDPGIFDADDPDFSKSENGFIKLTISKLYSVDGKTHQADGLKPDILLPDYYEPYYIRESAMNFPLSRDTFYKKLKFSALPKIDFDYLIGKSKQRLQESDKFKYLHSYIDSLSKTDIHKAVIPLKMADFWQHTNNYGKRFSSFDEQFYTTTEAFRIENHQKDVPLIAEDPIEKELNADWIKDLKTDAYIEEGYFILRDMIGGF